MKILIGSDIHGDLASARSFFDVFEKNKCERVLLLGDLLYHGPRNDLPKNYAPKEVITLLNQYKDQILAVRGNCDTEVDQMVLDFPILSEYIMLSLDGLTVIATHGHNINTSSGFKFRKGDILLHGHTHVLASVPFADGCTYLNPGSISLPKENNPKTYMIYENRTFTVYDFDGRVIKSTTF